MHKKKRGHPSLQSINLLIDPEKIFSRVINSLGVHYCQTNRFRLQ
ncbi:hypothetical protein [Kurthia zopfii]|nr:hypothetical protein [Kurthia zopfii]